ncbi:TspO/MBR family-domain-containing protein [Parachaetomium inaequale]|uniref:TspO/MBR family-domain-containing protein n=1 Tax=Parachaetomium inaequale TaxID=2588326 RepID=A0AAN6PFR5_9PEZI|nr:TspO/MBR family-domain-containing protein [Parachaetomium inaequale]
MTTYIPSLTLPEAVFNNLPGSVLLPIALGSAVGYSTRRILHSDLTLQFTAATNRRESLTLSHPPLRPPASVFPPVWTALYGIMGYAAHRAINLGTSPLNTTETILAARQGATLYTIQLGLNLAWMPLFYGLNRPVLATLDAAALLGINSYLAWLWGSRVDKVAGWLLAPYVAWLGFATYLSFGTGYLNDWDLSPLFGGRGVKGEGKKDA